MPPEAQSLFFNPLELIKSGLDSFSVAIQKPGDLILTDIGGTHQGYNTGNNLAIAVNWATKDWVFHSLTHHIHPVTHNIIYACQCWSVPVGIPFSIWSPLATRTQSFEVLYKLGKKESKVRADQYGSAETTWCFYIALAVEYILYLGGEVPWLVEGREGSIM